MNETTQKEIEIAAVLNTVVYMDQKYPGSELPVNTILQQDNATIRQPDLSLTEGLVLVDQSSTNDSDDWTDDLIQACTFRDAEGNYYVVFRGTGNGRWVDNADGLVEESTLMQRAACDYFDSMAAKYFEKAHAEGKKVIISGHSKGGNEAQYVFMSSKYDHLIDNCYSFDGQGFSNKALVKFKQTHGDAYEEKCSRMFSICGENDYVHDLGRVIIPEENTYFVPTSSYGLAGCHQLERMIGDKNGSYTGLKWARENGEITNGKQGYGGKFIRKLSEKFMDMDEEELRSASICIMAFMDFIFGNENYNDVAVNPFHFLVTLSDALPGLLIRIGTDPEAMSLLVRACVEGLQKLYEHYGPPGLLVGYALIVCVILSIPAIALNVIRAQLLSLILKGIQSCCELTEQFREYLLEIYDTAIEVFLDLYRMAPHLNDILGLNADGLFLIDTNRMHSYAQRLRVLNDRLALLDDHLNGLYLKVGAADLKFLLQADLFTCRNTRMTLCANYLQHTAEDFAQAEQALLQLQ